jgi:hypothetical protein
MSCYCPFKILWITKTPGGRKISNFKLLHGQKMSKIAEWRSQVANMKLRLSEKIVIAELQSCGCGATFLNKLQNCNCGSASFKLRNAIVDSKKSCACSPLPRRVDPQSISWGTSGALSAHPSLRPPMQAQCAGPGHSPVAPVDTSAPCTILGVLILPGTTP